MPDQPRGTVAFLFTDIAGSTRLWRDHPDLMPVVYGWHDAILRGAVEQHRGVAYKTVGDAFQVAFATAVEALAAALDAQRELGAESWEPIGRLGVRMALHAGAVDPGPDGDYRSPVLNRLGRLLATGHGGQVLVSRVAAELARDRLPPGAELRDLGEHRLKDLLEPERVFQLAAPGLEGDFPALGTLDARPNNLPLQPTPLVGREREVAEAVALLRRDEVRLLTLTGPGGTGKTRLGLQVAAELVEEFADGVFFVPLAPLADPALVPAAIAQVLGLREGGHPVGDLLRESVGGRELLLVLDNFEQVATAAPVVGELLGAGSGLKVLVTSRVPLRLRAERELAVPPLLLPRRNPPPTAEQLSQYEAVRLFIDRAQAVRVGFVIDNETAPAVAEICWRLDGLPLAIELAAARVRMLSPQAMLTRLTNRLALLTGGARDLPERQRTLREAIAWSHDLLSPEERVLFRRLAVFAVGFTFEAVEAVADPEGSLDALVLLERLVEHNLVRLEESAAGDAGEPRFGMLETIREFAAEQLAESGEEEDVRGRHAAVFLALAEEAEPHLRGVGQTEWLDRLEAAHDNLRAALGWALNWFWFIRGHLTEGRAWLERALASDGGSQAARVRALNWASGLAWNQGDSRRGTVLGEQGLVLAREIGDQSSEAYALLNLGVIANMRNEHDRSLALYEEALDLFRGLGDAWGTASILDNLGLLALDRGERERGEALIEESLTLSREAGDKFGSVYALLNLGQIAFDDRDYDRATGRFEEALAIQEETGFRLGLGWVLHSLGWSALAADEDDLAASRFEEALAVYRELGDEGNAAWLLHDLSHVAYRRGDLEGAAARIREVLAIFRRTGDEGGVANAVHSIGDLARAQGDAPKAAASYREALTLAQNADARRVIAYCLQGLAAIASEERQGPRAAMLFGAAEAARRAGGLVVLETEQAGLDREIAAVRTALGEAAFVAAWAEGLAMPREDAVAEALAEGPPADPEAGT